MPPINLLNTYQPVCFVVFVPTYSDSDAYEPLEDFLNLVKEQRPHVCILLGPFIDAKNELIVNNSFQV